MKYYRISIAVALITIFILVGYIFYQDTPARTKQLKALQSNNQLLQQEVDDLSFKHNVSLLGNKQLRDEISLLRTYEEAYPDMIDILTYSLTYINYLQMRMGEVDMAYPEFIVRAVLQDLIAEGIE